MFLIGEAYTIVETIVQSTLSGVCLMKNLVSSIRLSNNTNVRRICYMSGDAQENLLFASDLLNLHEKWLNRLTSLDYGFNSICPLNLLTKLSG